MWLIKTYRDSFSGLRKEVWYLSLVTLINRAGTMVFPFFSLYMTSDLGFTLQNAAWVMTAFGGGSVVGAWLGGKLTDKFGYYKTMFGSLFATGILFILIQFVYSIEGLCIGVFILLTVADTFRPASKVAIAIYSKPENRTRSISLFRLAINLGFSFGPAMGGFIIATIGYKGLFWLDGITCIAAALLFFQLLKPKVNAHEKEQGNTEEVLHQSPYSDKAFLLFLGSVFLTAVAFLQLFTTLPLFYRDVFLLTEGEIGWLLASNGIIIFIFEMPLIKYFAQERFSIYRILVISTLLLALGFFVLVISDWIGVLFIGMLFLTVGEIFNFPFASTFALNRAKSKPGEFMALYTMVFSLAHIFAHNFGMQLVDNFGFEVTWYVFTGVLVLSTAVLGFLRFMVDKDEKRTMVLKTKA